MCSVFTVIVNFYIHIVKNNTLKMWFSDNLENHNFCDMFFFFLTYHLYHDTGSNIRSGEL